MQSTKIPHIFSLEMTHPIWERFFQIFPLTLIGTKEADGQYDLAPKHMAMPLSWQHHFGFVCSPAHGTYQNIRRESCFTVSYPRPEQVVLASLSASPRKEDGCKPTIAALPTYPAQHIDGIFLQDAYLYLECVLDRFVDNLGNNSLIIGRVVAAHVHEEMLRPTDGAEAEQQIHAHPLLAYIHPGRFATVQESFTFPLPAGFQR